MEEPLRLLTVHAHPDDEASKGAGTVARYAKEGIEATLVCCTGGEAGEVLNPALDRPEVHADLAGVRRAELARSVEIIGYRRWDMLGYRDSGMPDSEANQNPDCFARAPLDEAVGRLVSIIRRDRPQVLVAYGEEQSGYPHPDHIRAHEIALAAWDAAGDPNRFPDAGDPFEPLKLYYTTWSMARIRGLHDAFLERGLESPFAPSWFERPDQDHLITTRIDVSDYYSVRADACGPMPPRSTPSPRSGSVSPTTSPPPSIRGTTINWPGPGWRFAARGSRPICSPGCVRRCGHE